jgi:hypothetical protein
MPTLYTKEEAFIVIYVTVTINSNVEILNNVDPGSGAANCN